MTTSKDVRRVMPGLLLLGSIAMGASLLGFMAAASPAFAGPPYVTDDPVPTDTGHWENYLYTESAHVAGQGHTPEAGIEVNYGAFEAYDSVSQARASIGRYLDFYNRRTPALQP